MIRVDVESTFEPIIGSELQSKELIQYLMKDHDNDPASIWKSEIFGRSLDVIVKEEFKLKSHYCLIMYALNYKQHSLN